MIDSTQWQLIRLYRPGDFRYPDKLHFSIVEALDLFSQRLGWKATVLSDWRAQSAERPGSQHPLGRAVDVVWPGKDTLTILSVLQKSRFFTGYGLYCNEKNVCSFHLDTRTDRNVDNPATWGAFIGPVIDPKTGLETRVTEYTSLNRVVEIVKLFVSPLGAVALVVIAAIAYLLLRKK